VGLLLSSVSDIVAEIASAISVPLETAPFEITVYPGMLLNPSTTAIDIYPDDPFRDPETAGMGDISGGYRFAVRARTGLNDLDSGQDILLALMDDENAYAVGYSLADDPTLNGTASDAMLYGPSGFREFPVLGGTEKMVGVVWNLLVIAAHS
jgi:hypothetical protein